MLYLFLEPNNLFALDLRPGPFRLESPQGLLLHALELEVPCKLILTKLR